MSATHLLLEGNSLPPLLAQAKELGGRVVHAERIRRGAWLFSGASRFEVTVEVPALSRRSGADRPQAALPSARRPPPDPDVPESLADVLFGFESADTVPTRRGHHSFEISPAQALRALGVPEALIPASGSLTEALDDLAARLPLPRPLAQAPGDVVAVVGSSQDALDLCVQMLRLTGAPVQLAHLGQADWPGGGHRLSGPESAARLRETARGSVVVAVIPTRNGRTRAGADEILRALAPTQVWAALDGLRPPAELRSAVAELSRSIPIGALAIRNAWSCSRPGALLGLGYPVGWLDGLPASRVVWARLLHEAVATVVPRASIGIPTG